MEQSTNAISQPLSITLEIVPEDEQGPDPAAISAFSRSVIDVLEQHGYKVKPIYTGAKEPVQGDEVKVSTEIDSAEIEITYSDMANDERIIQLAECFLALHSAAKVTPHSSVKVRRIVPITKTSSKTVVSSHL